MPWRQRNALSLALPYLHQRECVALEALSGRCKAGASLVAHEQPASDLLLQTTDTRADGRLGQMQPLRGGDEASAADDLEKSAGKLDIHS